MCIRDNQLSVKHKKNKIAQFFVSIEGAWGNLLWNGFNKQSAEFLF